MSAVVLLASARRGAQALLAQASPALAAYAPSLLHASDITALRGQRYVSSGAALLHAEPVWSHSDVLHDVLSTQLAEIHKAGTYKQERVIVTPQGTSVGARGRLSDRHVLCSPFSRHRQ